MTVSSYFQSRLTVQHCYKELKTFGKNSLQGSNEINSPFALIYRHNNQIGLGVEGVNKLFYNVVD